MNEEQIIEMFNEILERRSAVKELGISRFIVNNYRNKNSPTLGTMMELLLRAGKITITTNEPEATT
jgi:hypothetical protein